MFQRIQVGKLNLIELGNDEVPQHEETRYINATKLCQSRNKTFSHWRRLDGSQMLIDHVAALSGLPESELIVTISTGPNARRATWIEHRLAAALAVWVDPCFIIHCASLAEQNLCSMAPTPSPKVLSIEWEKRREIAKDIEIDLRRINNGVLEERDKIELMACHRNALLRLRQNSDANQSQQQNPPDELLISTVCRDLGIPENESFKKQVGKVASKMYAEKYGHPPAKRQMALAQGICVPVNYYTKDDEDILKEAVIETSKRMRTLRS